MEVLVTAKEVTEIPEKIIKTQKKNQKKNLTESVYRQSVK